MNTDGSGLQQLTNDPGDDRAPSWSPDGTRIAYQSMRDGNREIYTVSVFNPNDKQRLTFDAAVDALPSWSPDGSLIAFATDRWRGSDKGDIAVMSAVDGSGARSLIGSGNNLSPAWSPDGRSIAYVSVGANGNRDIYVYDMPTGNPRPLAADPGINEDFPAWSPDSQHIVFSRGEQIAVMNLTGVLEQILTATAGKNFWPDWRR
jgi:TolB protein